MRIPGKMKVVVPLLLAAGIVSFAANSPVVAIPAKKNQVKVNPAQAEICQRSLPILGVAFGSNIGPKQRGNSRFGLPIIYVKKDSPAEKAGIQVGDLLLTLDGQKLFFPSQFAALLRTYEPGDKVEVRFLRGEEIFNSAVELGVRDGHALNRASGEVAAAPANNERDDVRIVINGREISLSKNTELKNRVALTSDGIVIRTNPDDAVSDDLQRVLERFQKMLNRQNRFERTIADSVSKFSVVTTSSQVFANNENTVVFTRENDKRDVTVRTREGGEIFYGPCATQEEIDKIPPEVQAIIRQMTILRPLPSAEATDSEKK